jgi:hypothetical protein
MVAEEEKPYIQAGASISPAYARNQLMLPSTTNILKDSNNHGSNIAASRGKLYPAKLTKIGLGSQNSADLEKECQRADDRTHFCHEYGCTILLAYTALVVLEDETQASNAG